MVNEFIRLRGGVRLGSESCNWGVCAKASGFGRKSRYTSYENVAVVSGVENADHAIDTVETVVIGTTSPFVSTADGKAASMGKASSLEETLVSVQCLIVVGPL